MLGRNGGEEGTALKERPIGARQEKCRIGRKQHRELFVLVIMFVNSPESLQDRGVLDLRLIWRSPTRLRLLLENVFRGGAIVSIFLSSTDADS